MNTENDIITAIFKGEQQEKYAEWAKHKNAQIRYALAQQGYYPEIFIKDEQQDIQIQTFTKHPETIKYLLNDEKQYKTVNLILTTEQNIDIDVLKQHIEDLKNFDDEYYREDMELKLQAMLYNPTPIELTMTKYQLYLAKSPLWARDLSPEEIYYISITSEEDVENEFKN
mgnify:CR=1 FL=1